MTISDLGVDGYPIVVEYSGLELHAVYVNTRSGYNILRILSDDFKQKIINKIREYHE